VFTRRFSRDHDQSQVRGKQHIVPPKTGSKRDVPIPTNLTDTLTDHLTSVGTYGEEGWLFGVLPADSVRTDEQ
jgi:hypothetical protein